MGSVLVVVGTRPEAIKLAPVIRALAQTEGVAVRTCVTGQHETSWRDAFELFGISADTIGATRLREASLREEFTRIFEAVGGVLDAHHDDVDVVVVQGDTTSAYAAALAAFYARVPVAHVEAGLRTHEPMRPWPEELHRRAIAPMVTWHFAPSERARDNLIAEGIAPDSIHVVGNTVNDALKHVRGIIARERETGVFHARLERSLPWMPESLRALLSGEDGERALVVVTMHRRETFEHSGALERVCAVLRAATREPGRTVVWPLHPNEGVQRVVQEALDGLEEERRAQVLCTPPWPYVPFVALLERADVVLTDSGGIQEEAPVLRTPVVVLRGVTERVDVVEHGGAVLAPEDLDELGRVVDELMGGALAPDAFEGYGRGDAAPRIVRVLASARCL
ncbi:MAG: UDP-N-acetylglucosamine 2-epimerase (non-hydrolyzing) [Myxococcota bacterium]